MVILEVCSWGLERAESVLNGSVEESSRKRLVVISLFGHSWAGWPLPIPGLPLERMWLGDAARKQLYI